jgi:hypothetical protein
MDTYHFLLMRISTADSDLSGIAETWHLIWRPTLRLPYSEFKIRLCFLKAFGNLTAAVTLVGLEKSCILINLLMATYPFAHFLSVYFVDAKVSLSELYSKNVYCWIDVVVICHS